MNTKKQGHRAQRVWSLAIPMTLIKFYSGGDERTTAQFRFVSAHKKRGPISLGPLLCFFNQRLNPPATIPRNG